MNLLFGNKYHEKNLFLYLSASSLLLLNSCASPRFVSIETLRTQPLDQTNYQSIASDKTLKLRSGSSLSDLQQFAALNNASLKLAYLKWQAELLRVYPAGVLPDPQMCLASP